MNQILFATDAYLVSAVFSRLVTPQSLRPGLLQDIRANIDIRPRRRASISLFYRLLRFRLSSARAIKPHSVWRDLLHTS